MKVLFFDFNGNFIALFRDTRLATIGRQWPNMAKMAIYGHLAIGPWVTKKLPSWEGKVLEQKQKQF